MNKNLVWLVVILMVIWGVAVYVGRGGFPKMSTTTQTAPAPKQQAVTKGTVFAGSAVSKMAYEVFPGKETAAALVATKGWTFKMTTQKDGSTIVNFVPSEQEDQAKTYTVKKGETLYFVEVNPGDDTAEKDNYLADDYGVIVGADGTVQ